MIMCPYHNFPLNNNQKNFKLLGITLGRDKERNTELNITTKYKNISKSLDRWSQRNLSIIGKILVSKTHGMAKIVHTMTTTQMTGKQLIDLQRILTEFVWSKKPAKVKLSVLISPYEEGGLKAFDVECQYKALRIP